MADDEREVNICRVCRCEGTPENPLFYPCRCSGSIKYVHEDCLVRWLQHSQKTACELCEHPFGFTNIYRKNMPRRLPGWMLALGALKRLASAMTVVLRFIAVGIAWGGIVPLVSKIFYVLYFQLPEPGPIVVLSPLALLLDLVDGLAILAVLILMCLLAVMLREFLLSDPTLQAVLDREDNLVEARPRAEPRWPVAPPPPPPEPTPSRLRAFVDDGEHRVRRQALHQVVREQEAQLQGDAVASVELDYSEGSIDIVDEPEEPRQATPTIDDVVNAFLADNIGEDEEPEVAQGMGEPHYYEEHQAEQVEPPLDDGDQEDEEDMVAEDVDDADNGLGDALAAAGDAVPLEELLGMNGPWLRIVENIFWMLLCEVALMGCFIKLPHMIGDMAVSFGTSAYHVTQSLAMLVGVLVHHGSLLEAAAPLDTVLIPESLAAVVESVVADDRNATVIDDAKRSLCGAFIAEPTQMFDAVGRVILGYVVIALILLVYLRVMSYLLRPAPRSPFRRSHVRVIKIFILATKIIVFYFFHACVLPILYGFAVAHCGLPLIDKTMEDVMALLGRAPLATLFVAWTAGQIYVANLIAIEAILRDVARNGAPWFVRHLNYMEHTLRHVIRMSVRRQSLRLLVEGVLCLAFIYIDIGGAVTLGRFFAPHLFPIIWKLDDPIAEVPLDLLVYMVAVPKMIQYLKPATLLRRAVSGWTHVVARLLSLSSVIFGQQHADENGVPPVTVEGHHYAPLSFPLRMAAAVLLTIAACAISTSVIAFFPMVVGRVLMRILAGRPVHETYTYFAGVFLIFVWVAAFDALAALFRSDVLRRPWQSFKTAVRVTFVSVCLFVIFGIVQPLSFAVLYELCMATPLQTSHSQIPHVNLTRGYFAGLFLTRASMFAISHTYPNDWRLVKDFSISALARVAFKAVLPLLFRQLLLVATPPLVGVLLVKYAGFSATTMTVLVNIIYQTSSSIVALSTITGMSVRTLGGLHDAVRDDRFLIGRRLNNVDNSAEPIFG